MEGLIPLLRNNCRVCAGRFCALALVVWSLFIPAVSFAVELVKLPVVDQQDIRFVALSVNGNYAVSRFPTKPPGCATSSTGPKTLAALSEETREQLRNAVISLDVKRIADVIQQIADRDPAVGSALAAFADRFPCTAIPNALEDPRTGPTGEEHVRQ